MCVFCPAVLGGEFFQRTRERTIGSCQRVFRSRWRPGRRHGLRCMLMVTSHQLLVRIQPIDHGNLEGHQLLFLTRNRGFNKMATLQQMECTSPGGHHNSKRLSHPGVVSSYSESNTPQDLGCFLLMEYPNLQSRRHLFSRYQFPLLQGNS